MDLLDEQGRLFGRVNVVDAVVVVAALALLVGGAFVVLSGSDVEEQPDPRPGPERHATIAYEVALGSPMATLAEDASVGAGGDTFAVTDVYRSTTADGSASVVARLSYAGNLTVGGDAVLAGDGLTVATETGRTAADVLAVDRDGGAIDTTTRSLVVVSNNSSYGARAVDPGADVVVGGDTVATVQAVDEAPDGAVRVGVTIAARQTPAGPVFGGRPVLVGVPIGLVTDEAIVRGEVAAVGTSDPEAVG